MVAAALRVEVPTRSGSVADVLIVDDSAVARAVMARVIDSSERFAVAGVASHVAGALAFLAHKAVDYILLDINMPGVDGITALPDLLAASGQAKVLIVSTSATDGAAAAIQALAFGAADTMEKPAARGLGAGFAQALIDKLERLNEPRSVVSPPIGRTLSLPTLQPAVDAYDIVAIGASTGGIHALSQLLRELPVSATLPILVTQHLPSTFMPYFAAQLETIASRPCEVATDRLRVRMGRVIVAPGDAHMRCVPLPDGGACIRLSREPAASGCTPSVDPMLASVAAVYGERALGVVLSGMGRDGADGARLLRDAGGSVVAQDQASSVVWGMPGAVAGNGAAEALLTPQAIGRLIAERRRL